MPDLQSLPDDLQVEVANLSTEGQQQVLDAIAVHGDDGTDAGQLVTDAQTADYDRSNVEQLHTEQAQAIADGDYAKADDIAHQTEYQLQDVQDHGGDADTQMATTESDQSHLDWAEFHQESADQEAGWASDAAASGDADHAAEYAGMASDQAGTASYDATQADQGGTLGDHSFDSAGSTGGDSSAADTHVDTPDATVAHVDDTSAAADTSATAE